MGVVPAARDEELFVNCKTCEFPVASGIRMPPEELEDAALGPREHRCPRCGSAHAYERRDYFHRE